jgi:xanthine dehydrogenase molybdenum-binding subunit
MASMFHVGGGARVYRSDGCGAILKLDDFGRLTIITGASEIGQGSDAALAIIGAEALGLEPSEVSVIQDDTAVTPWDVGVHASRTTFIAGNAVRLAAEKLRQQIFEASAGPLGCAPADLEMGDHSVQVRHDPSRALALDKVLRSAHFREGGRIFVADAFYDPDTERQDKEFKGNLSAAYGFATHAAEVEVDLETGAVKVLRYVAVHDVGKVINPLGLRGQVEGGVVMGLGYALSEELQVREGRVENPSFADYRILTALDVPEIDIDFVETDDPAGPYGAKGTGEAPLIPVAAAVANAIFDATGKRVREIPATPERVLKALGRLDD